MEQRFGRCLFALFLAFLAGPSVAQPVCEHNAVPLFAEIRYEITRELGNDPACVVADFNNDDQPDLAWLAGPFDELDTKSLHNRSVSIALGCPCGRYTETTILDVWITTELVAGDFNADGLADLATNTDGLTVFYGRGDGTFDSPVNFEDAEDYLVLGAFDLDGDGDTDLLTDRGCFRADPPGFTHTQSPFTVFKTKTPFEFADLNGDGRIEAVCGEGVFRFDENLDIVAADELWPEPDIATVNLQIADFDRDGQLEVVTSGAPNDSDKLTFYEVDVAPDGSIGFVPNGWGDNAPYLQFGDGVRALDVDSDGWLDVVGRSTMFRPMNSTSTTTSSNPSLFRTYPTGPRNGPTFEYVDVNHDGTPDQLFPGLVRLARADSWNLPRWVRLSAPSAYSFTHLLSGDFDGDGLNDWFAETNGRYVAAFGNQPTPTSPFSLPVPQRNDEPDAAGTFFHHLIDLDSDGHPDIVEGDYAGRIVTYRNNTDRTFTRAVTLAPGGPTNSAAIDVADLDGDGDEDVVAVINDDPDLAEQAELVTFLNNNGVLAPSDRTNFPTEANGLRLLLTDMDGDGDLDAVATDNRDNVPPGVVVFERDITGAFVNPTRIDLGKPAYWMLETNIDNDPEMELLVSLTGEYSDGIAEIVAIDRDASGAQDWTLPRHLLAVTRDRINEFLVADLNHDSFADIALCTGANFSQNERAVVFVGEPGGTYRYDSELGYSASGGGGIASLLLLDVDQDGFDDLYFGTQQIIFDLQGRTTYPPCRSDMNADGVTDFGDIQSFIAYFLEQHPAADLNRDTIVDFTDIGEFVSRFVDGC